MPLAGVVTPALDVPLLRRGNAAPSLFRLAAAAAAATPVTAYSAVVAHTASRAVAAAARRCAALDRAMNLHLAGDAQELLLARGVVNTWEDGAWVAAGAALAGRTQAAVMRYRAGQVAATHRLPAERLAAAPLDATLAPDAAAASATVFSALHDLVVGVGGRRPDLATASQSPYVGIVTALLHLADAYLPKMPEGGGTAAALEMERETAAALEAGSLPPRAQVAVWQGFCGVVRALHAAALAAVPGAEAAVEGNRAALVAPAPDAPARAWPDANEFSPISPDALVGAVPLPPAAVPLLRFGVQWLTFCRNDATLQLHTFLDGTAATADALGPDLAAMRDECLLLADDIRYLYVRHLTAAALTKPAHMKGALLVAQYMAPARAVRALVAFLTALPVEAADWSGATPADGAGGGTDALALQHSRRRACAVEAYALLGGGGVEPFTSIFRAAVYDTVRLALRLDGEALRVCAAADADAVPPGAGSDALADALRAAHLPVPDPLPTAQLRAAGVDGADWVRGCALEWLVLLERVPPLVADATSAATLPLPPATAIAANALARLLFAVLPGAGSTASARLAAPGRVLAWLLTGTPATVGGGGGGSGSGGATATMAASGATPGRRTLFTMPAAIVAGGLPPAWDVSRRALPVGAAVDAAPAAAGAELTGWCAVARALGALEAWRCATATMLPPAPARRPGESAGGARVGGGGFAGTARGAHAFVTEADRAALETAARMHRDMVARRVTEVEAAAAAAHGALAELVGGGAASLPWLAVDEAAMLPASALLGGATVVGAAAAKVPSAATVRAALASALAAAAGEVASATAAWLAATTTASKVQ